jgi:hypothetical protein
MIYLWFLFCGMTTESAGWRLANTFNRQKHLTNRSYRAAAPPADQREPGSAIIPERAKAFHAKAQSHKGRKEKRKFVLCVSLRLGVLA